MRRTDKNQFARDLGARQRRADIGGMYVAVLKFSTNRGRASELMAAHNAWIRRGFDAGVFLLVGSIRPGLGGALWAHATTRDELEARLCEDPFVVHDVVTFELLEISATMADPRLAFLVHPS